MVSDKIKIVEMIPEENRRDRKQNLHIEGLAKRLENINMKYQDETKEKRTAKMRTQIRRAN